jgi:hypothetical protein
MSNSAGLDNSPQQSLGFHYYFMSIYPPLLVSVGKSPPNHNVRFAILKTKEKFIKLEARMVEAAGVRGVGFLALS